MLVMLSMNSLIIDMDLCCWLKLMSILFIGNFSVFCYLEHLAP